MEFLRNFACLSGVYVQTIRQVVVARALQNHLLQMSNFNRAERYADVRADKVLSTKLRHFVDAELSPEILKFLDAVDNFKASYDKEGT